VKIISITVKRTIQPRPFSSWTYEATAELQPDDNADTSTQMLIGYVDEVCDNRLDGRLPFTDLDDEQP
jgi:hypothetical protein